MKCAETTLIEPPAAVPPRKQQAQPQPQKSVITLPTGLLGFEKVKHYTLLGCAEEAPFLWLQMVEDPNLAFLVISPSAVLDSYHPDISEEEVAFLDLTDPKDALVFNIVTVHPDGKATVSGGQSPDADRQTNCAAERWKLFPPTSRHRRPRHLNSASNFVACLSWRANKTSKS